MYPREAEEELRRDKGTQSEDHANHLNILYVRKKEKKQTQGAMI
jgi:hypothetical protein